MAWVRKRTIPTDWASLLLVQENKARKEPYNPLRVRNPSSAASRATSIHFTVMPLFLIKPKLEKGELSWCEDPCVVPITSKVMVMCINFDLANAHMAPVSREVYDWRGDINTSHHGLQIAASHRR
jgi:hypothetical protein